MIKLEIILHMVSVYVCFEYYRLSLVLKVLTNSQIGRFRTVIGKIEVHVHSTRVRGEEGHGFISQV